LTKQGKAQVLVALMGFRGGGRSATRAHSSASASGYSWLNRGSLPCGIDGHFTGLRVVQETVLARKRPNQAHGEHGDDG
jgi:hypothetical protein